MTERRAPRARGPRAGQSGTQDAILTAARQEFRRRGYDATSLRGIAREAGVDARLVHHYFSSKEALFVAAMTLPIQPALVLRQFGEAAGAGERIVRFFFSVWDTPEGRETFRTLLGAAATTESAAEMLREFISRAIVSRISEVLDAPDATLRANLIGAQMAGVALLRYVIKMEPLASATVEEVVRLLAPLIQALRDSSD